MSEYDFLSDCQRSKASNSHVQLLIIVSMLPRILYHMPLYVSIAERGMGGGFSRLSMFSVHLNDCHTCRDFLNLQIRRYFIIVFTIVQKKFPLSSSV